jgi:hypothetical protein
MELTRVATDFACQRVCLVAVQHLLLLAAPKGVTLGTYAGPFTKQLKLVRALGVR